MEHISDHQKPQKPIEFSFGQENYSRQILAQDNYLIGNQSKTKYAYIIKLIQKYQHKPQTIPPKILNSPSNSRENSSIKKIRSANKPPLPPKSHPQKIQKQQQHPKKSIILSNSEIKAELQKSHQELLDKFKSPLHKDSKPIKSAQEKYIKSQNLSKKVNENEDQQQDKSAISTQNSNSSQSIPFIESVIISNQQSARSMKLNQEIRQSPVRELSEFQIPEEDAKFGQQQPQEIEQLRQEQINQGEKHRNGQNVEKKIQVKADDGQKMTIFWFGFLFVLIVLVLYPTDQQYIMKGL